MHQTLCIRKCQNTDPGNQVQFKTSLLTLHQKITSTNKQNMYESDIIFANCKLVYLISLKIVFEIMFGAKGATKKRDGQVSKLIALDFLYQEKSFFD